MKKFKTILTTSLILSTLVNGRILFVYFSETNQTWFLSLALIGFIINLIFLFLLSILYPNILFKTQTELEEEIKKHQQAYKAYRLAEKKLFEATLKQNGGTIFKQKSINKDPGSRPKGTIDPGPR